MAQPAVHASHIGVTAAARTKSIETLLPCRVGNADTPTDQKCNRNSQQKPDQQKQA